MLAYMKLLIKTGAKYRILMKFFLIGAFNSTSGYLDDFFNFDTPDFKQTIIQIYSAVYLLCLWEFCVWFVFCYAVLCVLFFALS